MSSLSSSLYKFFADAVISSIHRAVLPRLFVLLLSITALLHFRMAFFTSWTNIDSNQEALILENSERVWHISFFSPHHTKFNNLSTLIHS